MRVITFGNEKGGVGKTSTVVTVGSGLAMRGERVLILDTDAQGNCSLAFGMEKEPCFYDLIVRKASWKDTLRVVPYSAWSDPGIVDSGTGQLMLISSNHETRAVAENISDGFILLRRLAEVATLFDYVLIDTSPTPSLLHGAIYAATMEFVYVTICEAWSLYGLGDTVNRVNEYNPFRESRGLAPIAFSGIQPTRFKTRTVEHDENLNTLKAEFGDRVLPVMRDLIAWSESASRRKSIFAYAPESEAASDAWEIVDRIQGDFIHER